MKAKLVFMLLLCLLINSNSYSQLYRSNSSNFKLTKNENPVYTGLIKVRAVTDSDNSIYIQKSNSQGYFSPDLVYDRIVRENHYEKLYQEVINNNKQDINNYNSKYNSNNNSNNNSDNNYKSARDKEFDRNIKSVHDFCEFVKSGGNQ